MYIANAILLLVPENIGLAPVVQREDNSIQRIKCIDWSTFYPLDRVIRSLNNRSLDCRLVTVILCTSVSISGVDVEFWAHEHSYERLFPVYNHKVQSSWQQFLNKSGIYEIHILELQMKDNERPSELCIQLRDCFHEGRKVQNGETIFRLGYRFFGRSG